MQSDEGNLFTRDDTFFGVCEGLGQDLGIHPNFLRVALAGALFWNPPVAAAAYVAAGSAVFASRMIVPEPKAVTLVEPPRAVGVNDEPVPAEQEPIALAA